MTEEDFPRLDQAVLVMYAAYGRAGDELTLRAYQAVLSDLDIDGVEAAILDASRETVGFVPSAADIRERYMSARAARMREYAASEYLNQMAALRAERALLPVPQVAAVDRIRAILRGFGKGSAE